MTYDGDFLVFEGSHFRNGFMYKQFGMNAIVRVILEFTGIYWNILDIRRSQTHFGGT